jgi:RNA polymerase sigma-70 factor (ECF subfamily)
MKEPADAQLVRACLDGQLAAFAELVDRYQGVIYNAAYRITGTPEEARDVTQTVFVKAYLNLDRYKPRHEFFSWVFRIAVNESINCLKRSRRLVALSEANAPPVERNPEAACAASENERLLLEALRRIKVDYRIVIVMRHFLNCSYRRIADVLDVPEKTVKSRLFTARHLMRDILARRGVETHG